MELLRELSSANPLAFAESLKALAAEKTRRADEVATQIESLTEKRKKVDAIFADTTAKLEPLRAHRKGRRATTPKSKLTKAGTKQRASRPAVSRLD